MHATSTVVATFPRRRAADRAVRQPPRGTRLMLITCWSAKGGSGTTVTACALAWVASQHDPAGVLLVDLAGDVPAVLDVPTSADTGLTTWLAGAGDPETIDDLESPVAASLGLLARGPLPGQWSDVAERAAALCARLEREERTVIVDCGSGTSRRACRDPFSDLAHTLAARADASLLVTRACYLALRRQVDASMAATGVVLVAEPWRALDATDVEVVVGRPVVAEVPNTPQIARVVDAGMLLRRPPRSLTRVFERIVAA